MYLTKYEKCENSFKAWMNPGGNKSGYPGSQLKGCNMAMFLLTCLIGRVF
jgi:hypothetical protein